MAGLAVGGLAVAFAAGTDPARRWCCSRVRPLPGLIQQAAGWTVGALLLLILCKGLAYAISLSGFRGGPIFPSMFIGAAGGIALSHMGGLPVVAGAAMGVGAMVAGALKMPMTAVLLPEPALPLRCRRPDARRHRGRRRVVRGGGVDQASAAGRSVVCRATASGRPQAADLGLRRRVRLLSLTVSGFGSGSVGWAVNMMLSSPTESMRCGGLLSHPRGRWRRRLAVARRHQTFVLRRRPLAPAISRH